MKIKLLLLFALNHELFAFFSPSDVMDRMTLQNAKNMMLMPLHPERKIAQGMRVMQEMGTLFEYSVTQMSQASQRSIKKEQSSLLR